MLDEQRFLAATCTLTIDEVVYALMRIIGREQAAQIGMAMLEHPSIRLISPDKGLMEEALIQIKKTSLLPRDAIHYAAAKRSDVDIFVTLDKDFKKNADFEILSPKELIELLQK